MKNKHVRIDKKVLVISKEKKLLIWKNLSGFDEQALINRILRK